MKIFKASYTENKNTFDQSFLMKATMSNNAVANVQIRGANLFFLATKKFEIMLPNVPIQANIFINLDSHFLSFDII